MESKKVIAIGIAWQAGVLKACPVHHQLYCDEDVNPAAAFALRDLDHPIPGGHHLSF